MKYRSLNDIRSPSLRVMLMDLRSGPATHRDLAEVAGIKVKPAQRLMSKALKDGYVHISDWERSCGGHRPVYKIGPGENVPKPAPMSWAESSKKYAQEHKEKRAAQQKAYRAKNLEKARVRRIAYRKAHAAEVRESERIYRQKNAEKLRAQASLRRQKKLLGLIQTESKAKQGSASSSLETSTQTCTIE